MVNHLALLGFAGLASAVGSNNGYYGLPPVYEAGGVKGSTSVVEGGATTHSTSDATPHSSTTVAGEVGTPKAFPTPERFTVKYPLEATATTTAHESAITAVTAVTSYKTSPEGPLYDIITAIPYHQSSKTGQTYEAGKSSSLYGTTKSVPHSEISSSASKEMHHTATSTYEWFHKTTVHESTTSTLHAGTPSGPVHESTQSPASYNAHFLPPIYKTGHVSASAYDLLHSIPIYDIPKYLATHGYHSNSENKPTHAASGYKPTHAASGYKPTHAASGYKPTHAASGYKPTHAASVYKPTLATSIYHIGSDVPAISSALYSIYSVVTHAIHPPTHAASASHSHPTALESSKPATNYPLSSVSTYASSPTPGQSSHPAPTGPIKSTATHVSQYPAPYPTGPAPFHSVQLPSIYLHPSAFTDIYRTQSAYHTIASPVQSTLVYHGSTGSYKHEPSVSTATPATYKHESSATTAASATYESKMTTAGHATTVYTTTCPVSTTIIVGGSAYVSKYVTVSTVTEVYHAPETHVQSYPLSDPTDVAAPPKKMSPVYRSEHEPYEQPSAPVYPTEIIYSTKQTTVIGCPPGSEGCDATTTIVVPTIAVSTYTITVKSASPSAPAGSASAPPASSLPSTSCSTEATPSAYAAPPPYQTSPPSAIVTSAPPAKTAPAPAPYPPAAYSSNSVGSAIRYESVLVVPRPASSALASITVVPRPVPTDTPKQYGGASSTRPSIAVQSGNSGVANKPAAAFLAGAFALAALL